MNNKPIHSTVSTSHNVAMRPIVAARCNPARTLLATIFIAAALQAADARAGEPESCEFRVVDWNASGADSNWNLGKDLQVADFIIEQTTAFDANVITLQEVTAQSLSYLETGLPDWDCRYQEFSPDDYIAVCVDGVASNFNAKRLRDVDPDDPPDTPPPYWWGYVQVEYDEVLITSLHTRSRWKEEHVTELHEDVRTGIVSGDYNFVDPTVNPNIPPHPTDPPGPDWYQTDLDLEWTIDGFDDDGVRFEKKIDHILTVEEPQRVWGDAIADGSDDPPVPFHSAHRMLLGMASFQEDPTIEISITNGQPIEVDESCAAAIEFRIAIHDNCCLDSDNLALDVTASNPTANVTLGPVSVDNVDQLGPRDVEVTGHVIVSELLGCPAEVVIAASAQDCAGNVTDTAAAGGSASIGVVDTISPVVAAGDTDLYCLWPPNHKYVCFDAGQFEPVITDNCPTGPTWRFDACVSDQPDNGRDDGNTIDDCVIDAAAQAFCARSERMGSEASGRRYTIGVEATDACGNVSGSTSTGNIYVPRSRNPGLSCLAPAGP